MREARRTRAEGISPIDPLSYALPAVKPLGSRNITQQQIKFHISIATVLIQSLTISVDLVHNIFIFLQHYRDILVHQQKL